MKIRVGVDIACRAPHQASLADEHGQMLFVGHRLRTDPDELKTLLARLPDDVDEITLVMEPTRNARVALSRGSGGAERPSEQSADLLQQARRDRPA